MRYAEFRKQDLFVGSGVVEAGCKNIIGARLKQSGMEWTVRGANAIISLRCIIKSNRFEDFWVNGLHDYPTFTTQTRNFRVCVTKVG